MNISNIKLEISKYKTIIINVVVNNNNELLEI